LLTILNNITLTGQIIIVIFNLLKKKKKNTKLFGTEGCKTVAKKNVMAVCDVVIGHNKRYI